MFDFFTGSPCVGAVADGTGTTAFRSFAFGATSRGQCQIISTGNQSE